MRWLVLISSRCPEQESFGQDWTLDRLSKCLINLTNYIGTYTGKVYRYRLTAFAFLF